MQEDAMLKLLIVDDDPGTREGLALGLADSFEIGQATGGREALEQMADERPDVILLDQNMEGISGTHFLESIGVRAGGPAVVMFSAAMDVSLVRRALKLGALDCVAKPFSLEDLRGKLELAAKSRGGQPEAHRPFTVRVVDLLSGEADLNADQDLEKRRRHFARELFIEALRDTEGDIERAAARLGIDTESFNNTFQSLNRGERDHAQQQHPAAG
jgi:DNA-binding NtrC family response regulator